MSLMSLVWMLVQHVLSICKFYANNQLCYSFKSRIQLLLAMTLSGKKKKRENAARNGFSG